MTPDELEERLIDFAVTICRIAERLPRSLVGNHIARQLVESGTTPPPNYAEARSAESRRDFVHKIKVCLKELRETRAWLLKIRKLGLLPASDLDPAIMESDELISIFVTSVNTARRNMTATRSK